MKKVLLMIFCTLLVIICTSCVNVKSPTALFKKYEVKNANLVSANFNFIFVIENPNDIPLRIKDIEYKFYIEGNEFVKGSSEGFELFAKDKKEISIPIEINYIGALESVTQVAKALITGNKKLKYRMEGTLVVESLGASAKSPLDAQGELVLIN